MAKASHGIVVRSLKIILLNKWEERSQTSEPDLKIRASY